MKDHQEQLPELQILQPGLELWRISGEIGRQICNLLLIGHGSSLLLCLHSILDGRICHLDLLNSPIANFTLGLSAAFAALVLQIFATAARGAQLAATSKLALPANRIFVALSAILVIVSIVVFVTTILAAPSLIVAARCP